MEKMQDFTEGRILPGLLKFAMPVLLALFLQAMYGAVDLMVVGQFGAAVDVSAVSTGSQIMHTVTTVITGLAMGITVLVGQKIGEKKPEEAGNVIGNGICMFGTGAVFVTILMTAGAEAAANIMHAPAEAFSRTVDYIRICSAGSVFIIAYNVLGSVFRGIGDSKMPLLTVTIACICNIAGDLLFVAGFSMGAAGAALATVMSQGITGAFLVRIPVSWFMSRRAGVSLFKIGLATPCSSAVQIILCVGYMIFMERRMKKSV